MGKGDKKSKKGKRFRHSYGRTRLRKSKRIIVSKKKVDDKPKTTEVKKFVKPETHRERPAVVIESRVEEIKIIEPRITEIKEEVKIPVVKEESVSSIPEIIPEPIKEIAKPIESAKESVKKETDKIEETTVKKRGRPKKKKEE